MTQNKGDAGRGIDKTRAAGGPAAGTPAVKPRPAVISRGTWTTAGVMAVVVVALVAADLLSQPGQALSSAHDAVLALQYLMPLAMALMILRTARTLEKNTEVRTNWSLFGYALLSFGIGSVVLIVMFVVLGRDTYPSYAEIFTLIGYAIFGMAFYRSLLSYRHLLSLRGPLMIAVAVVLAALAVVYVTVVGPYVVFYQAATQSVAARLFNTLYLVLDAIVLLTPCVALALLLGELGTGRVAWPWWFVVAGAGSLFVWDAVFAYTSAIGLGRPPIVDFGYTLAPMLIGLAVLVARDVYRS